MWRNAPPSAIIYCFYVFVFVFVFELCVQVFTVKGRNEAANGGFSRYSTEVPTYLAAADWTAVSLSVNLCL